MTEIALTARAFPWLMLPMTFFFAVLSGMNTMSSWSVPQLDCPLRSRIPVTAKGIFRIRIICPIGSVDPKRLSATVCPTSATLVAPSMSSWLMNLPATTGHSRAIS